MPPMNRLPRNASVPSTQKVGEEATGVAGLAVVNRPDGTSQVTYKGAPLYTFAEDTSPGEVNGNGVSDSFNGTDFTWHVAGDAGTATTTGSGTGSYGY